MYCENCGVGRYCNPAEPGSTKRKPSVSTKKKALSLLIGPPKEAAHWLLLAKGRGVPCELLNQSFAFRVRPFHQYSPFPWNEFVPDLVAAFTWAPAWRPYCAV